MEPTDKLESPRAGFSLEEEFQEIEEFEREAQRFLRGELHEEVWRRFRLQHGIYGQRQGGTLQMVRIKIPWGGMTPDQMRAIAEVSARYSTGVAHVTTRQDIQIHFVKLENTPAAMRELVSAGLTTREACGNTVRNVSACPYAGVCPDELFDVTPFAEGTARFFLRNPICQNLPRKFKIAFTGCGHDCAAAGIHDLGAIAVRREVDGRREIGFRVTVGGGLGPSPRRPYLLEEFVPPRDLLPTIEAVLRVFSRHGNRKNRNLARIKFLLEKSGFEEFYRLFREEYAFVLEARGDSILQPAKGEPDQSRQALDANGTVLPEPDDNRYRAWLKTNLKPQRQAGYCAVTVRLVIGDLTVAQLRGLADLADRFGSGQVRNTREQNMLLRWVRRIDVPALYHSLERIGLAEADAGGIGDVVACPGADTCNLAFTGSKGLGRQLTEMFLNGNGRFGDQSDLHGITIKVSGCPNSCAQHHVANIGFHGVASKAAGRMIPAYVLHLGGRTTEDGVSFGIQMLKIPARRVPEAVEHLVRMYRSERREGEAFTAFVDRLGKARFQQELAPYCVLPSFEEAREQYRDWGTEEEFEIKEDLKGECAGGMVNAIEQYFEDAKYELSHARIQIQKGRGLDAVTRADLAATSAAKALLVMEAVEPLSYEQTIHEFEVRIVRRGMIPVEVFSHYRDLNRTLHQGPLGVKLTSEYIEAAGRLAEACSEAYRNVNAQLTLAPAAGVEPKASTPVEPKASTPKDGNGGAGNGHAAPSPGERVFLDLSGVQCPMNYVKTKLKLEELEIGQVLEVIIDKGEPYENVPRSVRNDGQKILELIPSDADHYRLVIEKVV